MHSKTKDAGEVEAADSNAQAIAHCIGCGCDDLAACCDEATGGPCSWLAVDRAAGLGVCSACPDELARWKSGDRKPAVPL